MRNPLVGPVIEAVYDMTRGFYDIALRDAAVTNLLQDLCSMYSFELSQFEQPLNVEVCARISVWQDLINREDTKPPDRLGRCLVFDRNSNAGSQNKRSIQE